MGRNGTGMSSSSESNPYHIQILKVVIEKSHQNTRSHPNLTSHQTLTNHLNQKSHQIKNKKALHKNRLIIRTPKISDK